jgi:hypothetical protein
MEIEIIVVIIASAVSLVLGIINIISNKKISAKQNKLELKKTRIDLLESRRLKIEDIKTTISNRFIDVSDMKDFDFKQYIPKVVDFFQKNSNNIFSIGHLLKPEFLKELKDLNKRIDEYILQAKQHNQSDNLKVKQDVELMSELNKRMIDEIDRSLIEIESQINTLLK